MELLLLGTLPVPVLLLLSFPSRLAVQFLFLLLFLLKELLQFLFKRLLRPLSLSFVFEFPLLPQLLAPFLILSPHLLLLFLFLLFGEFSLESLLLTLLSQLFNTLFLLLLLFATLLINLLLRGPLLLSLFVPRIFVALIAFHLVSLSFFKFR